MSLLLAPQGLRESAARRDEGLGGLDIQRPLDRGLDVADNLLGLDAVVQVAGDLRRKLLPVPVAARAVAAVAGGDEVASVIRAAVAVGRQVIQGQLRTVFDAFATVAAG